MDLRRLRLGEYVTAALGALLLVSLFLPWYRDGGIELTAWKAFALNDVLLAVVGVLAVGLLVLVAAQDTAAVGIAAGAMLTIVSGVVALVSLVRLGNLPGSAEAVGAGRTGFAYLGTLAAFGVVAGALLSMRDERLSKPGRPTDPTGVPVDAQPEVELLPAPRRGAAR